MEFIGKGRSLDSPLELGAFADRHIGGRGIAAQLQRADISGNGPSVGRFDAFRVGIHNAVALSHYVEEMSHRRLSQSIDMKGGRRWKTTLDDHAVAFAGAPVAESAINVVTFPPALQD